VLGTISRVDVSGIETDLLGQFTDSPKKLTVDACPHLVRLLITQGLAGPDGRVSDNLLNQVVDVATERAVTVGQDEVALPRRDRGALVGARAYFFFGGGPSEAEFESIRQAHAPRSVDLSSQACRFSWARWAQNRVTSPAAASVAPNEKSGRNQKWAYAAALGKALIDALDHPDEIRTLIGRESRGQQWSVALTDLLAVSRAYARDVAVDADQYVQRTIELELFDALCDIGRCWPRVLVGEAGSGKSTLLWSLAVKLNELPGVVGVLLSASWLLHNRDEGVTATLVAAFDEVRRAQWHPVLLLDTADLMLHDERSRSDLNQLLDALHTRGVAALYSTRPQEADLLTNEQVRRFELTDYDDQELDRAVTALVGRYCPHLASLDMVARIQQATARGLPVTDVCRRPLLLRMMFDLAAPGEPELADLDVTRLLGAYWDRRIRRDVRFESATALRVSSEADLSALAGHAGVGLLAAGIPELMIHTLEATTEASLRGSSLPDGRSIRDGLDLLRGRGVLAVNSGMVGFFHQTMFEFAAARGLLQAGSRDRIGVLVARTVDHGGDLFVGAVLEQVLILAGDNPLLADVARRATESTTRSSSPAVQAIGLAAWAHHPQLATDARRTLKRVDAVALQRAALILPSIAGKPSGQSIDQLILIWQVSADPGVRAVVAQSLARLALRAPAAVADALRYLDPVQAITGKGDDHDGLRRALLQVLGAVSGAARSLVRSTLVAMLVDPSSSSHVELDYLAEQWTDIGDRDLLNEILRAVSGRRESAALAVGLGKLIAREGLRARNWSTTSEWMWFVEEAVGKYETSHPLLAQARIRAIGEFLATLPEGDDRVLATIGHLLDASPESDAVIGVAFPDILGSQTPSSRALEQVGARELATVGLTAQQHALTHRQRVLLDALAQTPAPGGALARMMPRHLGDRDWAADPRLLRLVTRAADDGVESALRFLQQIREHPGAHPASQIDQVLASPGAHMPRTDAVLEAVVSIAVKTSRTGDLKKVVDSANARSARLGAVIPSLIDLARQLLDGDGTQRQDGAALLGALMGEAPVDIRWEKLRAILDSVEHTSTFNKLVQQLFRQPLLDDVAGQVEYLRRFVHVDPHASPPIQRSEDSPAHTDITTAVTCAEALLRVMTLRAEATPEAWPTISTLGLYEVEGTDVFVVGTKFVAVCAYLCDLGHDHPGDVGRFLTDYLRRVATGSFVGFTAQLWRRELRGATHLACADGLDVVIDSLLDICPSLDEELAQVVIAAIAERHYRQVRTKLQALARDKVSSPLRDYLVELLRSRDRNYGTAAFPEILALVGSSANPGLDDGADRDGKFGVAAG